MTEEGERGRAALTEVDRMEVNTQSSCVIHTYVRLQNTMTPFPSVIYTQSGFLILSRSPGNAAGPHMEAETTSIQGDHVPQRVLHDTSTALLQH